MDDVGRVWKYSAKLPGAQRPFRVASREDKIMNVADARRSENRGEIIGGKIRWRCVGPEQALMWIECEPPRADALAMAVHKERMIVR